MTLREFFKLGHFYLFFILCGEDKLANNMTLSMGYLRCRQLQKHREFENWKIWKIGRREERSKTAGDIPVSEK